MKTIVQFLEAVYGVTTMFTALRLFERALHGKPRPVPARCPFDSRRVATRYRDPEVVRALRMIL